MGAKRQAKRRDFPPNLYQQPNGYFYYRNPESKKILGLGRDKAAAMRDARAANAKLAEKRPSRLVDWVAGIKRLTLSEWLNDYVDLWVKESAPVARTVTNARQFIERIRGAEFSGLDIGAVTTRHVAEFLDAIESDGTALNMRSRLSDIFRMAEAKGLIGAGANPVTATKPRSYSVKRERLSLEQFLAIRDQVPKWAANGMTLALVTGQRLDDITQMRFADYRDGHLFITQGKTGFKLQQEGAIRLAAVGISIEEAVKQCRDRCISKYMVHHTKAINKAKPGDKVSAHGLSLAFRTARDELGITATQEGGTPPSFHEIRSLAERLYKKEYGAEFAQAIMGHKHAKMTAEYDDLRGSGWAVVSARKAM